MDANEADLQTVSVTQHSSSLMVAGSPPHVAARVRAAALKPGDERDHLYEDHPIVKNICRIATPPLEAAYDVVVQVVVHRDPSTCFVADFRIGKITAQTIICETLATTFPNLPVGRLIAKKHDAATEKAF